MPSDEEFSNVSSAYYYASFAQARDQFVAQHVRALGPTFYATSGSSVRVVLEDLVCDRYTTFVYLAGVTGQVHLQRLQGYGFGPGVVVESALDVVHLRAISIVPNVGPLSPGGPFAPYNNQSFRRIYSILVSQPQHVGVWLGRADGYVADDIFCFATHTCLRLGYDNRSPSPFNLLDPA